MKSWFCIRFDWDAVTNTSGTVKLLTFVNKHQFKPGDFIVVGVRNPTEKIHGIVDIFYYAEEELT